MIDQIDASRISPKLYVGSLPPLGDALSRGGFQVLVLCAQPNEYARLYGSYDRALFLRFQGLKVLRAPLDDQWPNAYQPENLGRPTEPELMAAYEAAAQMAIAIHRGQRVLVTCMKGRNRSAFVAALALQRLTGWSGDKCAAHVRDRRGTDLASTGGSVANILCNPWFSSILSKIAADRRPKNVAAHDNEGQRAR